MNKQSEIYARLLAPPFVEGLEPVTEQLAADPLCAWHQAQDLVRPMLRSVDWEHTTLLGRIDRTKTDGYGGLLSRIHAENLTRNAFVDALNIMRLCRSFTEGRQIPGTTSYGQLLLNSNKMVADVASLQEPDKNRLFRALSEPGISSGETKEIFERPFMCFGANNRGKVGLQWSPQVSSWILSRVVEGRGCAAKTITIVDAAGCKHNLVAYFWGKLVIAMYPL